jgi:hypothetical protein
MEEVDSYAAGEEPWTAGGEDLAFIHLPPHLVGNIAKDCVFIDAKRNFTKPEPDDCSSLIRVNSVFGARRRVHWRDDAARQQGDDVGKGRADIRGLARCRRSKRYVKKIAQFSCVV